ncbi:MAG TPA: HEAT repeat domain-containing protein, partial [Gemmatimonadales bacterium]|nr:HEAT repeat domain-containing protein [Gemmatimonadales bacterium]
VREIAIAADPPPGQLFELLKTLAEPPGTQDLPGRLVAAGVDRISARPAGAAPSQPPLDLGTDGILRGDALQDVGSLEGPVAGPDGVSQPAASLRPEDLSLSEPAPGSVAAAPVPQAPPEPAGAREPSALERLERNPRAANVAELLTDIARDIEEAMRARRPERAIRLLAGVARCEQLAPDGSQRRVYAIALKRMCTKPVLEALANLVTVPAYREDALTALQRAGADGLEVLLDLLVAAPTVPERQAIFGALTEMKEGTDQLVHMLGHEDWFVVRNVAELVGELGLEEAVPALARQLEHEDERVRRAVALALAKIGSRAAAEPLRRALRDPSPAVRLEAALGVGGRKSSALAMPLVVALEEEQDPEVERELILALGRIGSADAVQALIKFAQPAGRVFGRKPVALRVAAVEALRVAATPAAVGMLQGLVDDSDKQVRTAAAAALKDLKR